MSDLQKIWNDIPEDHLTEREIEDVINRKSVSEIESFKRVLKLEIYISSVLLIPLWLFSDLFESHIIILFGSIVIVGWMLNLFTLWKLKQLELFQSLKHFLVMCIKALKSFVIAFLLAVQAAGVFVIVTVKSLKANRLGWLEWLFSPDGLLLVLLLVVINAILISYAWVFYIKRIRSLTYLLKEIDSDY